MGYNTKFLLNKIELPKFNSKQKGLNKNTLLDYENFSIFFSEERKQPIYCAVNIDGSKFVEILRKQDNWRHDERILKENQISEEFYDLTNMDFHRGHLVRRLDPCWGTQDSAKKAEEDTFFFTNASPQHRDFNPRIWLELERCVLEKGAKANDAKISVFCGPILSRIDNPFIKEVNGKKILLPTHFWKIIVWEKDETSVCAVGFIQSQKDLIWRWVKIRGDERGDKKPKEESGFTNFENLKFKNDAIYQVSISLIEKVTGLTFDFKNTQLPKVKDNYMELVVKNDYSGAVKNGRYRCESNEENIALSFNHIVLE